MKRLLIPLLAALSLPATVNAETITLSFLFLGYQTHSLEEACQRFEKASKLSFIYQAKEKAVYTEYNKNPNDAFWTKEAYSVKREGNDKEAKELSTAVEVLRQAGYSDWKLYSRYNSAGVGDLYKKEILTMSWEEINSDPNLYKYHVIGGVREARDLCNKQGDYNF